MYVGSGAVESILAKMQSSCIAILPPMVSGSLGNTFTKGRSAGRLCQCTAYLSLMSMSKRPHVSVTFLVSYARPDWSIFGEKQNYLPPPNPPNGSSLLKVTQFGSDFRNFSLFASWRSRDTPTS